MEEKLKKNLKVKLSLPICERLTKNTPKKNLQPKLCKKKLFFFIIFLWIKMGKKTHNFLLLQKVNCISQKLDAGAPPKKV